MKVIITKNLKESHVRTAKHIIYAHQNLNGDVYIGQAKCMVNRWNEHMQLAKSLTHPESMQKFKQALRHNKNWHHYIIATASNQEKADKVEAAAIAFYKPKLNSHPGRSCDKSTKYDFQLLARGGKEVELEAAKIDRYKTQERFTDRERKTIHCKAILKNGKSHISFECIDDGFRVNVSHQKRVGFKEGDIVTISFAAKGKTFYTTTDYSDIKLAAKK
ncbi:GIY-YIG nuclease family protein [Pseudoalteromonas sp. SG45-5]|uniref:GIY-YIG nuclease family protein n=1 Tax=unclassified Pseudoalteromonas TaxID=194690 RepID=UPI0015FE12C1|nr:MULTISPECIES: GIY-YIG nuclease family protein [unclassified Pseudoalteromonas]MBB1384381.1 GIY-YIG nuclease family protein [Pseudoalteromonas sp. SG45-5]MBB1392331.1 GIY-YIG nuclease family protein [Pseudoalteromonas sp. SG44-4]MBB1446806.1 GIY-YIG nuclease family protein [Pseudoalteromonas sp. SG41-6]